MSFKVDDPVRVHDGSWSVVINNGGISSYSGSELKSRTFVVIATGGKYPSSYYTDEPAKNDNDIMLQDVCDGAFILFSQERFCDLLAPLPKPNKVNRVEVEVCPETTELVIKLAR